MSSTRPTKSSVKSLKQSLKRSRDELPEEDTSANSDFEQGSSQGDASSDSEESSEDEREDVPSDDDADAPRIAQWEADDDSIYDQPKVPAQRRPSHLTDLEDSSLRKSQKALTQVEPETESEDDSASDNESEPEEEPTQKERKVEWISHDPKKHARSSKHAPMEVTSKKPVTRKRTVVEVPKIVPRDPRFLPTTGEFKPEEFQKSYGFLAESRKDELKTLRESLSKARRALSSCPADRRLEFEREIYRLEQALKRTEGLVNKDRQDAVQRQALQKVKSEEKEKQKHGKGQWFLKDSEKRKVVQKARFEALSSEGGHRAVKKAIDRKQKKIGQKEKKSRPYARGAGLEESGSQRRAIPARSFWGPNKRQRFS
ncbi:DUF947-domain-containing protein [Coprinopsis sp. MPI-PUGE-AT-0042]|nr:DUF947-domain-containing protein [Coprinopsis sp. MPI-PUGE-AT-0042]